MIYLCDMKPIGAIAIKDAVPVMVIGLEGIYYVVAPLAVTAIVADTWVCGEEELNFEHEC